MRDYYERVGQYKPTQAITRPLKAGTKFCDDNFEHRELPKDATRADAIIWQVARSKDDYNYFHPIFERYPHDITQYLANKYVNLFKEKGAKVANTFFRKTLGANGVIDSRINLVQKQYFGTKTKLSTAFMHKLIKLPEYSREQIALLATEIANFINDEVFTFINKTTPDEFNLTVIPNGEQTLAHDAYCYLVSELKGLNMHPAFYLHYKKGKLTENEASTALAKATDIDWWQRQLKHRRDHQKEHLAIAAGQVQNKASPYASKSCQFEWREQKQNNREWAKNQVIQNEDGEQFELTLQIDKSNTNPAIRRCELMVRMRGFEDLADEYGYIGVFVTITAPSKYHACHSKGGFVDNWMGNNPRQSQAYLCNVWAKIRAKLSRDEIRYFGFRVVEPHHDGTPHWHLLVFLDPEHRDAAETIMRKYALEVDSNEAGAAENRFKFVDIEKEKGSATGYIAKYISKNIDGYALNGEVDDETGQDLKTMSKAVTAWASRWRIRQFQQIGGAPVTVYRELRRLKDAKVKDANIDPVLAAADVGCWATYTELQGGAMVKRKNLKVRISYEEKLNQFEEVQQKIKGVFSPLSGMASFICTRLIKWKIVKKSKQNQDLDLKNSAERAP